MKLNHLKALKRIQKQAENERSKHVERMKEHGASFPVYSYRHECRPQVRPYKTARRKPTALLP